MLNINVNEDICLFSVRAEGTQFQILSETLAVANTIFPQFAYESEDKYQDIKICVVKHYRQ